MMDSITITCTGWMFGIRDCNKCPPQFKDGCAFKPDEEWHCEAYNGYFDRLDPDEGRTCAFCGSRRITQVSKGLRTNPK